MIKKVWILLLFSFIGCATTQFIVLRDVPVYPVFTVIPASIDKRDIVFANEITRALIVNSVKVIERPVMITQTTKANIKQTGWNPETGLLGVMTESGVKGESVSQTGDIVELYSKTTADYICVGQAPCHLKIIKRETKEILFVGTINFEGNEDPDKRMRGILQRMGVLLYDKR